MPKFPNVTVPLTKLNGNVFILIGATQKAMRRAGIPEDEVGKFVAEAKSGDYDHAIQTIMATVEVE